MTVSSRAHKANFPALTGREGAAYDVEDWPSLISTHPTDTSLGSLAVAARDRVGNGTIVFRDTTRTVAELLDGSWKFAGGLSDIGVIRGDRVAVCMANCPEVLSAYHAIWRLGAVAMPLMFLLSESEIRNALVDAEATVIITTADLAATVQRAASGLPTMVVVLGAHDGAADYRFETLAERGPAPLTDVAVDELAVLLYTGGTTGRSKGVMLSHAAVSNAAWSGVVAGLHDRLTTSLLPLPLAHSFGLTVATRVLHAPNPTTTILMPRFDAPTWLSLVEEHAVDFAHVVPAMLRSLLEQPLEERRLSSLRRLVSGSAPLPSEVIGEWQRRAPQVSIVEGYGCSELCGVAATSPTGRHRAGSVGPALPGTSIRILDPNGVELPPGQDGEIVIRSRSMMDGYWRDPETSAFALRGGWLHTGDVGRLDEDGYLFIVDRIKDVIIRAGYNVYPRDVEETMTRHPAVLACAVVGRPDERVGEEVVAFVVLAPGSAAGEEELIAFARQHLSAVKYPRQVQSVASLPLTSLGKVDRKSLRTLAPPKSPKTNPEVAS